MSSRKSAAGTVTDERYREFKTPSICWRCGDDCKVLGELCNECYARGKRKGLRR